MEEVPGDGSRLLPTDSTTRGDTDSRSSPRDAGGAARAAGAGSAGCVETATGLRCWVFAPLFGHGLPAAGFGIFVPFPGSSCPDALRLSFEGPGIRDSRVGSAGLVESDFAEEDRAGFDGGERWLAEALLRKSPSSGRPGDLPGEAAAGGDRRAGGPPTRVMLGERLRRPGRTDTGDAPPGEEVPAGQGLPGFAFIAEGGGRAPATPGLRALRGVLETGERSALRLPESGDLGPEGGDCRIARGVLSRCVGENARGGTGVFVARCPLGGVACGPGSRYGLARAGLSATRAAVRGVGAGLSTRGLRVGTELRTRAGLSAPRVGLGTVRGSRTGLCA